MRLLTFLFFGLFHLSLTAQTESTVWFRGDAGHIVHRNTIIEQKGELLIVEDYTYYHSVFRSLDTLHFDSEANLYAGKHYLLEKKKDGSLVRINSKKGETFLVRPTQDELVTRTRNYWYVWDKQDNLRDSAFAKLGFYTSFDSYSSGEFFVSHSLENASPDVFRQKMDSIERVCLVKLDEMVAEKYRRLAEIQKRGADFSATYVLNFLKDFSNCEPDMRSFYWLAYNNPDVFINGCFDVNNLNYVLWNLDKLPPDLSKADLRAKIKTAKNHNAARRKLLRKLK